MSEISQSTDDKNKKIRSKKTSTRIDMTPMVDLAFLLLTFFVMTSSLLKPHAVQLDKPERTSNPPPIVEKNLLTVILGKDNKIYWFIGVTNPLVAITDFSKDGIRKILFKKKSELPKLVVLIKSNSQSRYQNMVDILDEMTIVGIERYALDDTTPADDALIKKVTY